MGVFLVDSEDERLPFNEMRRVHWCGHGVAWRNGEGTEEERRGNRGGIDGDDKELSQKWRGETGWKKVVGGTVGGKTHTNTDTDKVEEAKRGRIRGGGYK